MFVSVRKYKVRRGAAAYLARRVEESFVPLLKGLPGFQGYYLLDGGPDVFITISMFDSADEALASNEAAAEWVRDNVLEFTRGLPEVSRGNAVVAAFR
jgi:heme-degrading monooxygenase HmoA